MADPIPYPAWRYHTSGRTCIVANPEQDALLKKGEAGWGDKPKPAAPPPGPAPELTGASDLAPIPGVPAPVVPPHALASQSAESFAAHARAVEAAEAAEDEAAEQAEEDAEEDAEASKRSHHKKK